MSYPWEPRRNIDAKMREERFRELLQVTGEHPIIYHFARLYAHGNIVTFEETLQQIIRQLIKVSQDMEGICRDSGLYRPMTYKAEELNLPDAPKPTQSPSESSRQTE